MYEDGYNWQADLDVAQRFKESNFKILFIPIMDDYGYCFAKDNHIVVGENIIPTWFNLAQRGWPAALEELMRLNARVEELEEENERLRRALKDKLGGLHDATI